MKVYRKYLQLAVLVFAFVIELLILNNLSQCRMQIALTLLGVNLVLILVLFISGKGLNFKIFFGKVVRQLGASYFGLASILYFLANVSWLVDSIKEHAEGGDEQALSRLMIYAVFLMLPFVILTFLIQEKKPKVKPEDRRIFFTGLSFFAYDTKHDQFREDLYAECMNQIRSKHYDEWDKKVTWQPVFAALKKYENIESLVLLSTPEVDKLNKKIEKDFGKDYMIDSLIKKYFPEIKEIKTEYLVDANNIQTSFNQLKLVINDNFSEVRNRDFIFSITSGTGPLSAAMSLIAIKGERGLVYKRQDGRGTIVEDDTNVLNLKDLWEEIIELNE